MTVDRLYSDPRLAAPYDRWWSGEPRTDFEFDLPLVMQAGSVLDAGCGTGAMLHEARRRGHRGRLCGLDQAEGMLAQARRRNRENRCNSLHALGAVGCDTSKEPESVASGCM